jgi:methyltransferase (TIGR00027 family)
VGAGSAAMKENSASGTAMSVAIVRATHQLVDDEPRILEDPVVLRLIGQEKLGAIRADAKLRADTGAAAFRGHIVLRNRYAEDCLMEAVGRGVGQYVLLGAGYDTFAYRQPDGAESLRIFEVDHPASQVAKRALLASAGIEPPANLSFAPVNFENESLREGLRRAGLDFAQPAFFSCLGVLVYLDEKSVVALFEFVGSMPAGSELVFTFSQPDATLDGRELEIRAKINSTVNEMGEPWRSYFEPDDLRQMLLRSGFSEVIFLTPAAAEERYFRGRTDALRAPRRVRLCRATV